MNAIVVVDKDWGIGRDGSLLFSLPSDMKRFRAITLGGTVLMGRKTLESFPGGNPLPRRRNVVLSTSRDLISGAEIVHTMEQLREAAVGDDPEHVFVIGGGSVYTALLPYCQRALVTKADVCGNADTFFPNLDKLPGWKVEHEEAPITENGITYRFVDYVNTRI